MKEFSTEDLRNELALRGYQSANLWHIDEVLHNYKCSEGDALDIIQRACNHHDVIDYIFDTIDEICWEEGIKQKGDE